MGKQRKTVVLQQFKGVKRGLNKHNNFVYYSEELKQADTEKAQAVEALKNEKEKLTVELASSHKDSNILLNVC